MASCFYGCSVCLLLRVHYGHYLRACDTELFKKTKRIKSVYINVIIQYSVHRWVYIGLFSPLTKLPFMLIDQGIGDHQCCENNRKCLSFSKASYVTEMREEGFSYACSISLRSN